MVEIGVSEFIGTACTLITWITVVQIKGETLPHPDFRTGWMPIKNGLKHMARLDVPHGLNEVPVLVDVSVKVDKNVFPASGFRPDHPVEMSGPVVYIYNDRFINVSTSPNTDETFQVIPTSTYFYSGFVKEWSGPVYVRIRAWKQSTLPTINYEALGINVQAGTGAVSDSYVETEHGLGEVPCLVVARAKMSHPSDVTTFFADGVGSTMQTYHGVRGMTNAYLVYGYNDSHIRLWVVASSDGAIFDGRKHTWFDFVTYQAEVEIFVWACSRLQPQYFHKVETKYTVGKLPSWWSADIDYGLEDSLVRVFVESEDNNAPNKGFRFPASSHLGYPADRKDGYQTINGEIGGLTYSYEEQFKVQFWKPTKYANNSMVFIDDTFGNGRNTEKSNSEVVYISSWITGENATCSIPVIYMATTNVTENDVPQNTTAQVECIKHGAGYHLVRSNRYYKYRELEENIIKCDRFGVWENVPMCKPNARQIGEMCSSGEDDTCERDLAKCTLGSNAYVCKCPDEFKREFRHCSKDTRRNGTFLPSPDFDSGWVHIGYEYDQFELSHVFQHNFSETPALVYVQIQIQDVVFPVIGFPAHDPRRTDANLFFTYDENQVTVIGFDLSGFIRQLISMHNTRWTGWATQWGSFGRLRARAWKARTLPTPDFKITSIELKANTSKSSDSFAEVRHQFSEYPGMVVVRAKMTHNDETFYANGLGSALNVYYNEPGITNSYLVYGFNDETIRVWVDSSSSGGIFDGTGTSKYNFTISEATVEVFAWRISTLTPYFTHRFTLHDYNVPYSITGFETKYELGDAFNIAWVEIDEPGSVHKGYRFSGSTYMAMRFQHRNSSDDDCVFGGFMYGYSRYPPNLPNIYRPDPADKHYERGSTVCVPKTFGGGEKAGSASNGVGVFYSWIDPDCGLPMIENGHANTSMNGTYFGAVAEVTCDEGYHALEDVIVCEHKKRTWSYTRCSIDTCERPSPPENGMILNEGRKVYGDNVTFSCADGYTLTGSPLIMCEAGGEWSDEAPVCTLLTTTESTQSTKPVSAASRPFQWAYFISILIMMG